MSYKLYDDADIQDIADAIREKNGSQDTYKVRQMGDAIRAINTSSGLTEEVKQALLDCFENVAWINDQGQTYYDALYDALYPPANLVSISAVYTQSGTVYDTDALDSLRANLVVTAHYDDYSTQTISAYTLSGILTPGTSTITVLYNGKTTSFTVNVTARLLYKWNFKNSLIDEVGGTATVTLGGNATQSSDGVNVPSNESVFWTPSVWGTNRRYEIDFKAGETWSNTGNQGLGNAFVASFTGISSATDSYAAAIAPLVFRGADNKFEMYISGWQNIYPASMNANMQFFVGKTLFIEIDENMLTTTGYVDAETGQDVILATYTTAVDASAKGKLQLGRGDNYKQGMYNFTVEAIRVIDLSV